MTIREKLSEDMLVFLPHMMKKLMRGFPHMEISKGQFGLLHHIKKDDGNPMSFYSEKMMIPKPNITVMSDKLIEEGLVERTFDPNDRRVIILKITPKGLDFIDSHTKMIKNEMLKNFEVFDDNEIKRLNELVAELETIFKKLKH